VTVRVVLFGFLAALIATSLCPVRCSSVVSASLPVQLWLVVPAQETVTVSFAPLILTVPICGLPGPMLGLGGGGLTRIESAALACWPGGPGSLTVIVKLDVPPAVGVPEITPVEAFRLNPAGSAPELTDHV